MPSVRVKRANGYTSLHDASHDAAGTPGPSRRPRRSSVATLLTPHPDSSRTPNLDFPMHASPTDATGSPLSRRRALSLSTAGRTDANESELRPLRRRSSSKVSNHIMSMTRTPTGPLRNISEERDPFAAAAQAAVQGEGKSRHRHGSLSRHREGEEDDMISLQGPQMELLVPKTENGPGRVGSSLSLPRSEHSDYADYDNNIDGEHHPDDIVEHLDVIDPQIATVATLTNAANAIVIPPLEWYSRKPVVVLPSQNRRQRRRAASNDRASAAEQGQAGEKELTASGTGAPAGEEEEEQDNLDMHVEDVLRKRDRFRRVMRGVWSFVKTPLGIVTAIYGLLVVFWGTALVFFLARFINVHNENTQDFWVEVCQQIETGLFSITSIGLMPFRIVDTYRVLKIWHYKRKTEKLRRAAGLPELYDPNDLPDPKYDANYVPVLTEEEQIDLHYQQHKFMQSQTWYRPHGTQTHRAFPINDAVWITIMNDLNSVFQCLLSGCMWGLNRFERPAWTTATTLPLAFVAGIVAGVLIWWGSKKTKRVKEVTDRLMMVLSVEPSAASTSTADAPAIVLHAKPEQTPSPTHSETATAADGVGVPPARATSQPGPKPQPKDYADATIASAENTPTIGAVTPAMATQESLPTPSLAIADEMIVPPAEHLNNKH